MKCNVGNKDKIFRYVVGVVIILVGIYYRSWWGAIGLIPILTAAIRWCPVYGLFGLSTCKEEEKK